MLFVLKSCLSLFGCKCFWDKFKIHNLPGFHSVVYMTPCPSVSKFPTWPIHYFPSHGMPDQNCAAWGRWRNHCWWRNDGNSVILAQVKHITDLQMSCRDLTTWLGTMALARAMATYSMLDKVPLRETLIIFIANCFNLVLVHDDANGNVFRVTGPLWGESTGHWCIPLTNASDVELWCFL